MDPENPNSVPPPPPNPVVPPPVPPTSPPRVQPGPGLDVRPVQPARARGWKIAVVVLSLLLLASLFMHLLQGFLSAAASVGGADTHLLETVVENNHSSAKIAIVPVEGIITGGSRDGSGDRA